jgi:hypothetical protein
MTWFHSYIDRGGHLIVNKYLGEQERQRLNLRIKQEVGTFQAADIQQARNIALSLRGIGVPK